MSFFEDTPFISTGHHSIDGFSAVSFVIIIGTVTLGVIWDFMSAFRAAKTKRRRPVRMREVQLFLVLALVAFVVVTYLRFEHRRLKLVSWDEINAWSSSLGGKPEAPLAQKAKEMAAAVPGIDYLSKDDIGNAAEGAKEAFEDAVEYVKDGAKKAHMPSSEEIKQGFDQVKHAMEDRLDQAKHGVEDAYENVKNIPKKFRRPTTKDLKKGVKQVQDSAQQASNFLVDNIPVPKELAKKFPWVGNYFQRDLSMWDSFKLLVNTRRRFWWTQQWMTGYLTFALFAGIESRQRGLPSGTAVSFVILSYCFSLAAAQSLFFAFLLLKARPSAKMKPKSTWLPSAWAVLPPVMAVLFGLPALPNAYLRQNSGSGTVLFNVFQGVLFLIPAGLADVIQDKLPWEYGMTSIPAKALLSISWFSVATFILVLHVSSTIWAVQEIWAETGRWWLFDLGRWSGSNTAGGPGFASSMGSILTSLGDHAWLNAVGWDVLLSTLSLCLWAVVSSADVRSMIKCSLWPWLDETIEAVQEGIEVAQEMAEPYVEATKDAIDQSYQAAEPYAHATMKGARKAVYSLQYYLEGAKEQMASKHRELGKKLHKLGLDPEELMWKVQEGMSLGLDHLEQWRQKAAETALDEFFIYHTRAVDEKNEYEQEQTRKARASSRTRSKGVKGKPSKSPARGRSEKPQEFDDTMFDEDWDPEAEPHSKQTSLHERSRPASRTRKTNGPPPNWKRATSRARSRTAAGEPDPPKRRSSRNRDTAASSGKRSATPWYKRRLSSADLTVPTAVAEGAEAAGLAWCLWVIGGLGFASAAVFGADEIPS